MVHVVKRLHTRRLPAGVILHLILSLCCLCSGLSTRDARAGNPIVAGEPVISLEVRNQPLGKVLEQITQTTGRQFAVDAAWRNHPITVAFHNLTLSQGLKRMLAELNHAVIYETERDIRIIIFGRASFKSVDALPRPRPAPALPIEPQDGEVDEIAEELEPPAEKGAPPNRTPESTGHAGQDHPGDEK